MKTSLVRRAVSVFLLSAPVTGVFAQDLSGKWSLRIEDLKHHLKATTDIRFSNDSASSCMAGSWRRVEVDAHSVDSSEFFPLDSPLAYSIENGTLVMGRTQVCDGYLFLAGEVRGSAVRGNYTAVSIRGSAHLGYFSLIRTP